MDGYVKIYRTLLENEIWKDLILSRLFLIILLNAVYLDEGVNIGGVKIMRGQWLRSYRNIMKDMEYVDNNQVKYSSLATIKRKIDRLIELGMVQTQETALGTLFTVVNYEKYQGKYNEANFYKNNFDKLGTPLETPSEQERNNNKKDKKEKNIISIDSIFDSCPSSLLMIEGFKEAFTDWYYYSNERKKTLTPIVIKKQFESLDEMRSKGVNIIEQIKRAITGQWTDIHSPKELTSSNDYIAKDIISNFKNLHEFGGY